MFLKHVMGRRVFIGALLTVILFVAGSFVFTAKDPGPLLAFSFSHYHRESDQTWAVVEMRNAGSKAACYWGSAVDSPYYSLMVESDGQWSPFNIGFCGVGAREVLLHPGQTTKIHVLVNENKACKVGVRFRARTLRDLLPGLLTRRLPPLPTQIAWSAPIRPETIR